MRVLVLGGYGNFGAVISRRLAEGSAFELTVAGRDGARARQFAAPLGVGAAAIDTAAGDLGARIAACAPHLVVSTAGPFQGQDHHVPRAAMAAGAHYVDIADARAFVCGITALDAEARERNLLVVSGASSVPALSSAVIDRYAGEFAELREIDMAISSSERVPGLATVAGMLTYCGKPLMRRQDGAWIEARGWQGLRRHAFADPPMARWICDCDVPDLEIFPARYPGVQSVRFGAGVELAAVQLGLWLFAAAVRAGWVRDAPSWAGMLSRAGRAMQVFGSGRSAMFVRLAGRGIDGRERVRTWELTAAGNEGAHVPCLAAVALARKLASGALAARGATPCVGLLTLDEYCAEMKGLKVRFNSEGANT
jgi:saccharopine dehydrogenase-like protein